VLELPTDFPRPPVQTWNGSTLRFELAADLVADLRRLGKESRASLFSVLLAAVSVLLHQATGQRDLVVGTPFAGRSHPDLEDQVGLYVNTLALRNRLREDEPFADLLERVRKNATEAFENAEYPLDLVVADLDRKRDWSRSPLFDVLLMLEDDRRSEPWGSLALSPFEIDPEVSLFDLSFHFTEREAGLDLALLWNRDLFKPERMRALYDRLTHLLRDLASHPGKPIAALGREEGRDRARRGIQLVSGFNL
jgi:non-ribosomal peptide synthetase component F